MIRVLICDDHQIVRQGIRQMLADAADIALVAEADSGPAALKLVRAYASGGQKSAHEIHLTDAERQRLLGDMRALLDDAEDSFMLFRLDPRATVETLGRAVAPSDVACMYFG